MGGGWHKCRVLFTPNEMCTQTPVYISCLYDRAGPSPSASAGGPRISATLSAPPTPHVAAAPSAPLAGEGSREQDRALQEGLSQVRRSGSK